MKVVIDKKARRRMYTLHRNLRKKGNDVVTKQRFVTKRAKVLSEIEQKWCNELVNYGYCVGDGIFTPDHYLEIDEHGKKKRQD